MITDIMDYVSFVGWTLLMLSWCFSVVEASFLQKFVPFFFTHGIVIKRKTYELPMWHYSQGQKLSFVKGIIKIISEKECLFRTNDLRLFVTIFSLRGIITWDKNKAQLTARLPNGPIGFIFAFIIIFISGTIMAFFSWTNNQNGLVGFIVPIMSLIIVTILVIYLIKHEIKVCENIIETFIDNIKKQELTNGSTAEWD